MTVPPSSGDPPPFQAQAPRLARLARRVLGEHRAAADDVVQDTYLAAWTNRSNPPKSWRRWLGVVASKLALQVRRSEGRRRRREERSASNEQLPSTLEIVEERQRDRHLLEAVARLPVTCRTTLEHRYFDGLPPRRIAELEGVPLATVKTRLRRGLALLRADLAANEPRERRPAILALLALRPAAAILLLAIPLAGALPWLLNRGSSRGDSGQATADSAESALSAEGVGAPSADRNTLARSADPAERAAPPSGNSTSALSSGEAWGRVLDEHDTAVAGASVQVLLASARGRSTADPMLRYHFTQIAELITDGEGWFRRPALLAGEYSLRVSAPGWATWEQTRRTGHEFVDVTLQSPARVTGTVEWADSGERVRQGLLQIARANSVLVRSESLSSAGTYSFDDLAPGEWTMSLTGSDFEPQIREVNVRGGEPTPLDWEVSPGADFFGTVQEAGSRRPLPQARISCAMGEPRTSPCDPSAGFSLRWASSWERVFRAECAGYAHQLFFAEPGVPQVVEMQPAIRIRVRCLTRDGIPVAGAHVNALRPSLGRSLVWSGRTNAHGELEWDGLSPGASLIIAAVQPGFADAIRIYTPSAHGDENAASVELVLDPGAALSGTFQNEDGTAWPESRMFAAWNWRSVDCLQAAVDDASLQLVLDQYFATRTARVDSRGTYSLTDLPAGRWELTAETEDGSARATGEIELESGAVETLALLTPTGVTASGHVRVNGRAADRAQVSLLPLDESSWDRIGSGGNRCQRLLPHRRRRRGDLPFGGRAALGERALRTRRTTATACRAAMRFLGTSLGRRCPHFRHRPIRRGRSLLECVHVWARGDGFSVGTTSDREGRFVLPTGEGVEYTVGAVRASRAGPVRSEEQVLRAGSEDVILVVPGPAER